MRDLLLTWHATLVKRAYQPPWKQPIVLPDSARFGDPSQWQPESELPYVIQHHDAERAGPHYDFRMGNDRMMSWATPRELPEPGKRIPLYQTPLHSRAYANFEGKLPSGFGKGTVKKHQSGKLKILEATPHKIRFSLGTENPVEFAMERKSGVPENPRSQRQATSQGGTWLMKNMASKTPAPVAPVEE